MNLNNQRRIVAKILKVGSKRVYFDPSRLDEIKEAITKSDLKSLIIDKAIKATPIKGISKGRIRKAKKQKRKGRRQGEGSRKGKATSRRGKKEVWVNKIRLQRKFLRLLKAKGVISQKIYRDLYKKAKGDFFRSKRHIQVYIKERGLTIKNGKE